MTETHSTRCAVDRRKLRSDEGQVCADCVDRLDDALADILVRSALLPVVSAPGSAPLNDMPHGKQVWGPAPTRLDVTDLLDGRPVTQFRGAERDIEYRGALGILCQWHSLVRDRRRFSTPTGRPTIAGEVKALRRNLSFIVEQDFVADFAREIFALHRDLQTVWGEDDRPKSIGRCPATKLVDEDEWSVCNVPLFAPLTGDVVTCGGCHTNWTRDKWLLLGRMLDETTTEEAG